jgi:low temperature requirement protein LtrA
MTLIEGLKLFLVLYVAAQLVLVAFYLRGSRRHGHNCFLLLAISTVLGVISTTGMSVGYFVTLSEAQALQLYQWGLLFAYPALLISFWGMVSLLRSYSVYAPPASPPP